MAVPDRRGTYDYFRPHSTTAELLEANFAHRVRPTPAQVFAQNSLHCLLYKDDRALFLFQLTADPRQIKPLETLKEAYNAWVAFEQNRDDVYRDVHCWVFTPSSLELILWDLKFLGLTTFIMESIVSTNDGEFYVHLRNGESNGNKSSLTSISDQDYERRAILLRRTIEEAGASSRDVAY